jgi:hypothetical protein
MIGADMQTVRKEILIVLGIASPTSSQIRPISVRVVRHGDIASRFGSGTAVRGIALDAVRNQEDARNIALICGATGWEICRRAVEIRGDRFSLPWLWLKLRCR